jgi:hypothetical protein
MGEPFSLTVYQLEFLPAGLTLSGSVREMMAIGLQPPQMEVGKEQAALEKIRLPVEVEVWAEWQRLQPQLLEGEAVGVRCVLCSCWRQLLEAEAVELKQ